VEYGARWVVAAAATAAGDVQAKAAHRILVILFFLLSHSRLNYYLFGGVTRFPLLTQKDPRKPAARNEHTQPAILEGKGLAPPHLGCHRPKLLFAENDQRQIQVKQTAQRILCTQKKTGCCTLLE
jgi:hypothetical protein